MKSDEDAPSTGERAQAGGSRAAAGDRREARPPKWGISGDRAGGFNTHPHPGM